MTDSGPDWNTLIAAGQIEVICTRLQSKVTTYIAALDEELRRRTEPSICKALDNLEKASAQFRFRVNQIRSIREKEPYMTHTEATPESARHLEHAARCLAALARAMSEATDEECKRRIADAICHALSDVARAGAVFRTTGNTASS